MQEQAAAKVQQLEAALLEARSLAAREKVTHNWCNHPKYF